MLGPDPMVRSAELGATAFGCSCLAPPCEPTIRGGIAALTVSSPSSSASHPTPHARPVTLILTTLRSCSLDMFQTASKIVDVFRAVVPTLFGGTIATVPRLAMLFHNDCLYIAHRLVTMCHDVRQRCVLQYWPALGGSPLRGLQSSMLDQLAGRA